MANRKYTAQKIKDRKTFDATGEKSKPIPASIWGQLEPLDKKAREKMLIWGDTLPSNVQPELAGMFRQAYENLGEAVEAEDVIKVNKIALELIKGWDVLERNAIKNGHEPLPKHCYAIEIDGDIICVAMSQAKELREKYPTWIVYDWEDVARIIKASNAAHFLKTAIESFPDAKIKNITVKGKTVYNEDEIPF